MYKDNSGVIKTIIIKTTKARKILQMLQICC